MERLKAGITTPKPDRGIFPEDEATEVKRCEYHGAGRQWFMSWVGRLSGWKVVWRIHW